MYENNTLFGKSCVNPCDWLGILLICNNDVVIYAFSVLAASVMCASLIEPFFLSLLFLSCCTEIKSGNT